MLAGQLEEKATRRVNPEIDRIARRLEPRMRRDFLAALDALKSDVSKAELERAIGSGSLAAVQEALHLDRLRDELEPLADTVLEAVRLAGAAEASALAARLRMAVHFDLTNPRAIDYLRAHGALLVREVSAETRDAIRVTLERGFTEGFAPPTMARKLRDRLGLTRWQAEIVANYEDALRAAVRGEMTFEALQERFGLSPLRGRGGLVSSRIDALVQQYEKRLLRLRADMIARTETVRAATAGQQELWRQLEERGALPGNQEREWVTAHDERTCPICRPLDGVRVGIRNAFPGGLQGSDAHPGCRCAVILVFPR